MCAAFSILNKLFHHRFFTYDIRPSIILFEQVYDSVHMSHFSKLVEGLGMKIWEIEKVCISMVLCALDLLSPVSAIALPCT